MYKQDRLPVILCALYCFFEVLLSTEIVYLIQSQYLSIIKYSIAILVILYFLLSLLNAKLDSKMLCLFFLLAIAGGVLFFAKSLHILMLVIFLYLFRDYKLEYLLKHFYVMLWIAFCFTVFMSLINVYPNINHSRQDTIRHALGFATPTLGQSVLLFLFLTKFYMHKNKISFISILFFSVLLTVMYYFTAGRTGFYLGVLAVIFIILYKISFNSRSIKKFFTLGGVRVILFIFPVLCLLLSLLMTKLFDDGNEFAIKLNEMLSTRLLLQRNAFAERDIFIFGQDIDWRNEEGIYIGIDNSFLYFLFNYGIIVFVLAIAFYCMLINSALKNRNYCFLLILFILLINALVEPYLIDFKYNFFVFYPLLFRRGRETKKVLSGAKSVKKLRFN